MKTPVGEALDELKTAQAEPSDADSRDRPDAELSDEEPYHIECAEAGLVDEFDERYHE